MRELLIQVRDALRTRHNGKAQSFDEASMYAAEKAIDRQLDRSRWVKVADGSSVVPEGRKGVHVWVWNAKYMVVPVEAFMTQRIIDMVGGFTHWQYRQDDTPAPPEDL